MTAMTAAPVSADTHPSINWIRPWYPGGEDVAAGRFGSPAVHIGHIYADCEELLAVDSDPKEGSGWLDPRRPGTCQDCLRRYDPPRARAVFDAKESGK